MTDKRLKVTLVRSKYGRGAKQLATVHGLGLRKVRQTVRLKTHRRCVE
ncbi:MAG: hypothetical protein CM1200mP41_22420 [Gammaproteobacteria bacterium]|nr:MAG: hypothetical protein CM1200mP41_22420 [Gammaproteobacteria bacterium]